MVGFLGGPLFDHETIHAVQDVFKRHISLPESYHLAVIVLNAFSGGDIIVSDTATDAFHLIRGNGNSLARSADEDATPSPAFRDVFGRGNRK